MNTLSDSHAAIYEEPVDERIRKFLKLEDYFLKLNYHKNIDSSFDSFSALSNIILIYNTLSRVEVKSELIREIEFQKTRYQEYIKIDGSDKVKLNSIMEKQEYILNTLHNLKLNYLNDFNNDEFFQFCIKHIETNNCELDYWLTRDYAIRLNQLNLWIELIKPIQSSISFCLDILRRSSETDEVCAKNGFHLVKMDNEKKIRLLRITMQTDNYYFPRISIGPQRATITFMMLNDTNKFVQLKENVSFVMDLCYI
jgi:cell division protein ZapD